MIKNLRVDTQTRAEHVLMTGWPMEEKRNSGRTTAIALHTIGEAMMLPGKHVAIKDHTNTVHSHRRLAEYIMGLCERLQLQHFKVVVDRDELALVYAIFEVKSPSSYRAN